MNVYPAKHLSSLADLFHISQALQEQEPAGKILMIKHDIMNHLKNFTNHRFHTSQV